MIRSSFAELFWPDVRFYARQKEIIYSVRDNNETIVPAGNKLGKDFVAGFIALWYFCCHPVTRVVTTSVKDVHLRVLWGEIGNFIRTAKHPLSVEKGGNLIYNHHDIKKLRNGEKFEKSYLRGMVSFKGEGMAGHHAPHTLAIFDEASGTDQYAYEQTQGWTKRKLIIGNPNPCTNFFFQFVEKGDVKAEDNGHLYKKVIHVSCYDSPNIRYALAEKKKGLQVSDKEIIPGVLTYSEYLERRATWDKVRQCVGLDGHFYKGGEVLLLPPDWLNQAEEVAAGLPSIRSGRKTLGIDPAEGGDDTAWTVIDELGIIEQIAESTPDTNEIVTRTIGLIKQHNIKPRDVIFDRGGGGKQIADQLRVRGYPVRTVSFGESAGGKTRFTRSFRTASQHRDEVESRYTYKNRRCQIYGTMRIILDPGINERGFGIPSELTELRRQLSPIPYKFDDEGRFILPPKSKRNPLSPRETGEITLTDMLGCSPDEADSFGLALYAMFCEDYKTKIGAVA